MLMLAEHICRVIQQGGPAGVVREYRLVMTRNRYAKELVWGHTVEEDLAEKG